MSDLTQFDIGSAVRVSRVVRQVEGDYRRTKPLEFSAAFADARRGEFPVFRICTFSGAWAKGDEKTVSIKYAAVTATATAINLFASVPAPQGVGDCAIARDGTAWFLIAAEC